MVDFYIDVEAKDDDDRLKSVLADLESETVRPTVVEPTEGEIPRLAAAVQCGSCCFLVRPGRLY